MVLYISKHVFRLIYFSTNYKIHIFSRKLICHFVPIYILDLLSAEFVSFVGHPANKCMHLVPIFLKSSDKDRHVHVPF